MTTEINAEQVLDSMKADAPTGHDPTRRWVHSFGCGVTGYFVASDVAGDHCRGEIFSGAKIPMTARFSNGANLNERHDERPDARGLAVKFHQPQHGDADMISMTIPVLGADTRPEYIGLTRSIIPQPIKRDSWLRRTVVNPLLLRQNLPDPPKGVTRDGAKGLLKYAGSHHFAIAFAINAGLFMVPVSWARTKYHLVHTFLAVGPDGVKRPVRFEWQPVDGVFPLYQPAKKHRRDPDPPPPPTDFLTTEMRDRLRRAPARFTLKMVLGDPGDELDKPSVPWPDTRRVYKMGTLFIDKMADDQGLDVDTLSFNPMRLPDGIEPSDDEMLKLRGEVYQLGCAERNGIGCPLQSGDR